MYIPKHFDQPGVDVLHELMRARPLATLVTLLPSGLNADHIPLHLSTADSPLGTLRGHVARGNPLWREHAGDVEVLAVFQGADAYVTPSWYPTKHETGKAVPTWNYAVAHACGALRVIDDAVWLREHLATLTAEHEAAFAEPWRLADAPGDYVEKMIGAVVGIEVVISHLSGKWKLSQNQPTQNRDGVIDGLREGGKADALAIAALIERAGR
jgi:transcriptional regulator